MRQKKRFLKKSKNVSRTYTYFRTNKLTNSKSKYWCGSIRGLIGQNKENKSTTSRNLEKNLSSGWRTSIRYYSKRNWKSNYKGDKKKNKRKITSRKIPNMNTLSTDSTNNTTRNLPIHRVEIPSIIYDLTYHRSLIPYLPFLNCHKFK